MQPAKRPFDQTTTDSTIYDHRGSVKLQNTSSDANLGSLQAQLLWAGQSAITNILPPAASPFLQLGAFQHVRPSPVSPVPLLPHTPMSLQPQSQPNTDPSFMQLCASLAMYSSPNPHSASSMQAFALQAHSPAPQFVHASNPSVQPSAVQYPLSDRLSQEHQRQLYAVALAFKNTHSRSTSPSTSTAVTTPAPSANPNPASVAVIPSYGLSLGTHQAASLTSLTQASTHHSRPQQILSLTPQTQAPPHHSTAQPSAFPFHVPPMQACTHHSSAQQILFPTPQMQALPHHSTAHQFPSPVLSMQALTHHSTVQQCPSLAHPAQASTHHSTSHEQQCTPPAASLPAAAAPSIMPITVVPSHCGSLAPRLLAEVLASAPVTTDTYQPVAPTPTYPSLPARVTLAAAPASKSYYHPLSPNIMPLPLPTKAMPVKGSATAAALARNSAAAKLLAQAAAAQRAIAQLAAHDYLASASDPAPPTTSGSTSSRDLKQSPLITLAPGTGGLDLSASSAQARASAASSGSTPTAVAAAAAASLAFSSPGEPMSVKVLQEMAAALRRARSASPSISDLTSAASILAPTPLPPTNTQALLPMDAWQQGLHASQASAACRTGWSELAGPVQPVGWESGPSRTGLFSTVEVSGSVDLSGRPEVQAALAGQPVARLLSEPAAEALRASLASYMARMSEQAAQDASIAAAAATAAAAARQAEAKAALARAAVEARRVAAAKAAAASLAEGRRVAAAKMAAAQAKAVASSNAAAHAAAVAAATQATILKARQKAEAAAATARTLLQVQANARAAAASAAVLAARLQSKQPAAQVACQPMPVWASTALRSLNPFFQAANLLAWKVLQNSTLGPAGAQFQRCSMPFTISAEEMVLIRMGSKRMRVLVTSLLPEESTLFRCHWYGGTVVMVNDHQVAQECGDRTCEPLTANQCDIQVDIATLCRQGNNAVDVFWPMGRGGAMIVFQLVSVRSTQEVKASLRSQPTLHQHMAQMAQLVAGDSSIDDDCVQDKIRIGLRCPVGMMRISTPVYFASCSADAVFDLDTFLSSVERSGKWKCPHTGRLCNSGELQVHTYLQAVLRSLQASPTCTEVDMVEINSEGLWRPIPTTAAVVWYDVRCPEVCVDGRAAPARTTKVDTSRQTLKPSQAVVDLTGDDWPAPFTFIKLE